MLAALGLQSGLQLKSLNASMLSSDIQSSLATVRQQAVIVQKSFAACIV
jgi:hypothetical protein